MGMSVLYTFMYVAGHLTDCCNAVDILTFLTSAIPKGVNYVPIFSAIFTTYVTCVCPK